MESIFVRGIFQEKWIIFMENPLNVTLAGIVGWFSRKDKIVISYRRWCNEVRRLVPFEVGRVWFLKWPTQPTTI